MFKKLKKIKDEKIKAKKVDDLLIQFQNILTRIRTHMEEYSDTEKIELLSFVLTVIMNDIRSEFLAVLLYSQSDNFKTRIDYPFPFFSINENNERISFETEDNKQLVDLSSAIIVSCPWNLSRYFRAMKNLLHHEFKYNPINHYGVYYEYLNFGYLYNGIHHVSVASTLKDGKLMLSSCDITEMFKHIKTDGVNWYSTHKNIIIDHVWDTRCALIYEIAKIKYELEQKLKGECL